MSRGSTIDQPQCEALWAIIAQFPPHMALSASRALLNGWRTTHRLHEVHRGRCVLGCDEEDSLSHYISCRPLHAILQQAMAVEIERETVFGLVALSACQVAHTTIVAIHILSSLTYRATRAHRRSGTLRWTEHATALAVDCIASALPDIFKHFPGSRGTAGIR